MAGLPKVHPDWNRVVRVAVLFWVCCSVLVLVRYYGFYPSYATFDQGIFNQVYWNSLHGDFFQSSLSATESIAVAKDGALPDVTYHRLGQHFTPALMLWLPIYALFQSAAGLSLLQVTLITAAGLVLYALARCYHPPKLAAWIAISYFAANAVIGPTLANFHDFSQLPLFLFAALLAMEKRQWGWFWGLVAMTLLIREDAGVVLWGVGIYAIAIRRSLTLGIALCVVSLGYMLTVTSVVMPMFSQDVSRRFVVEQFGQFVEGDEASIVDLIGAIVRQPWVLLVELISPVGLTIRYLLAQWLPLAFVPAISPSAWLIAGFPLVQTLMRQDPAALMIDRRYAIAIVPGLFYGAILWWSVHRTEFQPRFRRIWLGCMVLAVIISLTANPNRALSVILPDSFQPWVYTSPMRQWNHAHAIRDLMARIPADASVSATSFIVPHLSGRREALRFPELRLQGDDGEPMQVDYAIADLWQFERYQAAYPWEREQLQKSLPAVDRMLEGRYGLVGFQDGVLLMQRRASSDPDALKLWARFRDSLTIAG